MKGLATMSEASDVRTYDEALPEDTGWLGWILFAGVMMIVLGIFHAMAGLVALFHDDYYVVRSDGLVVTLSYTGWGWIHLILGVVVITAGVALFQGHMWSRIVAVVVAVVSAVGNLAFLSASPVWSAIMIAVDILVIYALTAHGREI
ncbi:MAG: Membrane protein [Propionibacteriaceae bacterium]|jgi:hypothetical protein|nr:Membrane protein [Propionibacteriaceae bacterium]